MRTIGWLLWKEALAELRGAERLPGLALFSIALVTTLHFALPPEHDARPVVAPGFLWAALVFCTLLEVSRGQAAESADATLDGLRVAPVDPTLLYLARVASSLVVVTVLACVLVPMTSLFFGAGLSRVPAAVGVCVLGSLGLVGWGVLFAAVTGNARSSDVVLPVLLFPLLVPQTIAGVRLLGHYLGAAPMASTSTGFVLLAAFDVLAIGTSVLLFDFVLQD